MQIRLGNADKKPSSSPATTTIQILFDLVIVFPIDCPMGVIDKSTPNKNTDKPIIMKNAPKRNLLNKSGASGVTVK